MSKYKMIVEQEYWDNSYSTYNFKMLPKSDPTREIIDKYIPEGNLEKTVFELGCFPGRYLIEFCRKKYILNGCDLTSRVMDLVKWLESNNCKVGSIQISSFENFIHNKYDIVASFGFIEHFTNFLDVYNFQLNMVKPNGLLILQFPNFKGFLQNFLHRLFDIDNLKNHVIQAMDLEIYIKNLPSTFEIIYAGYYGNFDFWIDDFRQRNGKIKQKLLYWFFKTKPYWSKVSNSKFYSPYAILIARRKGQKI